MLVNDILKMDGRKQAPPTDAFPLEGMSYHRLTAHPKVSSIKLAIKSFDNQGFTNHSGSRLLLEYVVAYCEENKISYTLRASFSVDGKRLGYYLTKEKCID